MSGVCVRVCVREHVRLACVRAWVYVRECVCASVRGCMCVSACVRPCVGAHTGAGMEAGGGETLKA